jgi:hypothetical protein
MKIDDKKIKEFQEMYKARFGISLSKEEAVEIGLRFLNLVEQIYRPIHKN